MIRINLLVKTVHAINTPSIFHRQKIRGATNLLFECDIGGFISLSCATNAGEGACVKNTSVRNIHVSNKIFNTAACIFT